MVRKGDIQGVEVVGSKSMARERERDAEDSQVQRKKRKVSSSAKVDLVNGQEETKDAHQGQVFRFMELPGEIRNRIYAHAEEYAHRCFPPIFPKDKSASRRDSSAGQFLAGDARLKLPHMGLTQANSQIRSEFRPAWLSTHNIPLFALPKYLKAFFPIIKSRTSPQVRKRLESQFSPSGSLRLWLRKSELVDVDIISILRHAARFPETTLIVAGSLFSIPPDKVASIQALVSNKTDEWINSVGKNKITQVRVIAKDRQDQWLHIVVKERFALEWMKPALMKEVDSPEYLESLGLRDMAETWRITFGVEYS
ncbi:hypothetical protein DE146DRAFT_232264 [Phaeosphaeria sp. MPI-PUGE-AT-0046c]|nr:hypothetical protein DE146DRAFT_232264 [Phaeosphaeria sp. MPI-PUGE-AT-0046c]